MLNTVDVALKIEGTWKWSVMFDADRRSSEAQQRARFPAHRTQPALAEYDRSR